MRRNRVRLLLGSSSVAALLASTGAPSAFACYSGPFAGGYTNAGTTACITVSHTSFTGTLGNSGTITPGPTGIAVLNASTITGSISDSGVISASSHGILIDNTSRISNAVGSAIVVTGTSFAGGISNAGTVSVGGGIHSPGIILDNTALNFSGGIINSGSISAAGTDIVVQHASTFSGGLSTMAPAY